MGGQNKQTWIVYIDQGHQNKIHGVVSMQAFTHRLQLVAIVKRGFVAMMAVRDIERTFREKTLDKRYLFFLCDRLQTMFFLNFIAYLYLCVGCIRAEQFAHAAL